MTPYYTSSQTDAQGRPRAVLYCGDCLDVLQNIETGSLGGVIADSPYSSGGMVRSDRMAGVRSKYATSESATANGHAEFSGDNRDQRAFQYWSALWLGQARRATVEGGVIVTFTDWRQIPITTDAVQAGGWIWRGVVPWVKNNPRPQKGRFASAAEYFVWGTNGPRPMEGACHPGVLYGESPRSQDRHHITQKPVEVMQEIVRVVPPGDIVFDPFLGSGTTAEAALLEGRRFVGVELSEHFCEIAAKRIDAALSAPTLFAPPPPHAPPVNGELFEVAA